MSPLLYRWFYLKWKAWDRMGPPPLVLFLGLEETGPMKKFFYNILRSRSFASMSAPSEHGDYEDDALADLYPVHARGSIIDVHVPPESLASRDTAESTIRQFLVTRTSALRATNLFKSGAHSFTTSRQPIDDSRLPEGSVLRDIGLSHNNIVLGNERHIPGKELSPAIRDLYADMDEIGGLMIQKSIWAGVFDQLSMKGLLFNSGTDITGAADHSTQTPQAVLPYLPSEIPKPDAALVAFQAEHKVMKEAQALKGGIDMNSRFIDLKITGDTGNLIQDSQETLAMVSLQEVAPHVSQIIPVTPAMLQTLLTEVH